MARMTCKCGEVLSNTLAPNDIELRVLQIKSGMILSILDRLIH